MDVHDKILKEGTQARTEIALDEDRWMFQFYTKNTHITSSLELMEPSAPINIGSRILIETHIKGANSKLY